MVEEIIGNIIEAEKTSETMIKDSQVKAKEMISKAKEESIIKIEDDKKRVKNEIDSLLNNATLVAEEKSKDVINTCVQQVNKIGDKAMKNVDKAVDYIIGRMTSKYDK